jgi:hypothetical protein
MNDRWRPFFSTATGFSAPEPMASLTVPPPSNFFRSSLERIHRSINPEPPVSIPMPVVDFEAGYHNPFAVPEPASESTAEQATESAETDKQSPPVLSSPERDLAAEVSELVYPVGDYLGAFVVQEQPDNFEAGYLDPLSTSTPASPEQSPEVAGFETRKATLLASLQTWADSLHQFLEDHRNWRLAELRKQHAAAWRTARDQDDIVRGLAAQANQAVGEIRRLKAELSKVRLLAQSHEAAEPNLDALPSQNDLDAWGVEDARLKAAWAQVDQAVASALDRQRTQGRDCERESRKRVALRQTEAELRGKLTGEAITATGLEEPPEL